MSFEIVHKPTFTNQLLAIPRERLAQVLEKVETLRDDPHPHGTLKKKLHGYAGKVYRLRSGDYRILYTYGDGWVSLLGVDNRKDVYRGSQLVAEAPAVSLADVPAAADILSVVGAPDVRVAATLPTPSTSALSLPTTIDAALLERLRIPAPSWSALLACRTLDDLLAATIPDDERNRVFDVVTDQDYDLVLTEPDFVTGEVDDLLRFAEGELLAFLLKLSPEQERYVAWALGGGGPTLLKGGPGTGKSTIALYRTRSMIHALRAAGIAVPQVLFTTYTTALVASSEQLLGRLLGEDAWLVTVKTADRLVRAIVESVDGPPQLIDAARLQQLLAEATRSAAFPGTGLERRRHAQTLATLSPAYILEEIGAVIHARQLSSLEEYLAAPRAGRRVGLSAMQRTALWSVHEALERALTRSGLTTWHRLRRRAVELVEGGAVVERYDGVVIDEVQDLDPTVVRLLVALSRRPNGILVAADANQSIYGSGFRWADVHQQLRFTGRTGVLKMNYRSTREIGEAADHFAGSVMLDRDEFERGYLHSGPLPAVRTVRDVDDEARLLDAFLTSAARWLHLHVGAGAVLVPSERSGHAIVDRLVARGLPAAFMAGRTLDLERRSIKVLTLQSAKGLEFPFVALAGFLDYRGPVGRSGDIDEASELDERERRTLFVGMTRAMRALLVLLPDHTASRHGTAFDSAVWNTGAASGT